jgi:transposase
VSADQQPSYEELAAENAQLRVMVELLRAELAGLRGELGELKAQLVKNSTNSSKPPSSDGLVKPAPKSLRGKSGRRPGGQKGHPGRTLAQVPVPDEEVRHEPRACRGCGEGLSEAFEVGIEPRQVFDIPQIRVRVTEHRLVKRRCGCGVITCGDAPAGVDAPVQYGPNAAAIVVYLYAGQFLSKQRTAQALAELFGTPISGGTVAQMTARAADGLGEFTEQVRDAIATAELAHFDETGLRVQGAVRWVHSASTSKYSLITVHDKRGVAGMDAAGVLPAFTGIAVHDGWAPYDTYTGATHVRCNAHVLRELQAVIDQSEPGTWCWAGQAADALRAMKDLVDAALAIDGTLHGLNTGKLTRARHSYRSAARLGQAATAARATKLQAAHHALARRLIDRQDDHLRFTQDPRVPFDNNPAEREVRMIKVRQKVSGCLRTLTGAAQFCAIRSYLATAAKHGIGFFNALVQLAEGHPWLPATT